MRRRDEFRAAIAFEGVILDGLVIDFGYELLEGELNVAVVLGGGLNERKAVLLAEGLRLLGSNFAQVAQIAFVTNQHDNYVGIGVLAQLCQPALNIVKCVLL